MPKIMGALAASAVVIVLVLAFTKIGHDIDAATQHFMLYYAGVFALVGLTGAVLVGLLATDRIVMTPGHRVMAQAVHRAVSFGALAFLIIHILTEILAQRAHALDAVIPFLSPFRTFYIGLGTIASDLIVLIVVTGIIRTRFTAHGKAWRWRAVHYTSYVAFVFGVLHGLLGGRAAKPYVDWSYGFAIAVTAFGLGVRFLAASLRPKEAVGVGAPPGAARAPGPSPMRAAALNMAQAQLGGTIQVLPAAASARTTVGMPGTGSWAALPAAPGWSASPAAGPLPALSAPVSTMSGPFPTVPGQAPTVSGPLPAIGAPSSYAAEPPSPAYRDLGFTPLGAPPYGDEAPAGVRGRRYVDAGRPVPTSPARPALPGPGGAGWAGGDREARQPRYEPGYDGPPRFEGAPRRDVPQDQPPSYPYGHGSGPAPRSGTGPMPRVDSGPMPRVDSGPMRRVDSGPMPRLGSGPMPRPGSAPGAGTGPMPRVETGPMPRAGTGPMPRPGTGPMRRADTGPMPRVETGPMPRPGTGPMPRAGTGPMPRVTGTGPVPRGSGQPPPPGTGPRTGSGPMPPPGTGPVPRADTGPLPRAATGPMPRVDPGSAPRADTGSMPRAGTGPVPRTTQMPAAGSPQGQRTGRGRRGTGRPARGAGSADRRRREGPGSTRGDE